MGFFDSIKNALGGKSDDIEASVKGPSVVLKEAGIDPDGLHFTFGQGSIGVSGRVADSAAAEKIVAALEAMPNIERVDNQLEVGPAPAEPELETGTPVAEPPVAAATGAVETEESGEVSVEVPAADAGDAPSEEGRTYTVQSGDSLWKIAAEIYGNGADYPKIFEANRDILDDPDLIHPGQVLRIPDPD